jgi:hypothetical protein
LDADAFEAGFAADDFAAAGFAADDFAADDFAAVDFAADDFAAVDFAADDFAGVDFAAAGFAADDFAAVAFDAAGFVDDVVVACGLAASVDLPGAGFAAALRDRPADDDFAADRAAEDFADCVGFARARGFDAGLRVALPPDAARAVRVVPGVDPPVRVPPARVPAVDVTSVSLSSRRSRLPISGTASTTLRPCPMAVSRTFFGVSGMGLGLPVPPRNDTPKRVPSAVASGGDGERQHRVAAREVQRLRRGQAIRHRAAGVPELGPHPAHDLVDLEVELVVGLEEVPSPLPSDVDLGQDLRRRPGGQIVGCHKEAGHRVEVLSGGSKQVALTSSADRADPGMG